MTHLRQGYGGQARDKYFASLGYAWMVREDRRDGTAHLMKRGVAVCGRKSRQRDTTPYFGNDWPRLCKTCLKISGSGR